MIITCPHCGEENQMLRMPRSFVERYISRIEWNKYRCTHCEATVFLHRVDWDKVVAKVTDEQSAPVQSTDIK